ncbi:MAG: 16S rRNA (guanine(527)-N(7))-methyltransferase RsmG [Bacteroidales bacterium]|jgi:16S rRNA (guanine527-N7)-methyltransferase|nr:16S rRNA (guanine(527)-N(7))-methyltransferase RsmG [Bacteroidales bacterium]
MTTDVISRYFPRLSAQQREQFDMLLPLYREWNARINVISRKDINNLYEHHVLHSLAVAKFITFMPEARILDAGTGGGFPGIPLAILFPDAHFHLIDSIGKKLKVVAAITETLGLHNVTTQHIRAEDLKGQYDFAVSRAVTSVRTFMSWMDGKFLSRRLHEQPNGVIFLKGGNMDDELDVYRTKAAIFPIGNIFAEPFFAGKKIVYLPVG